MLDKFCFFLSLSTGAVVIGILNVVYGLLQTLVIAVSSYHAHHPFHGADHEAEEVMAAVNVVYSEDSLSTMQFLFGIYLIYGSLKEKPNFLFATIIMHLALIIYSFCFVVFAIVLMLMKEEGVGNSEQLANEALKIPILMYFVFIIYGRQEELLSKSPTLMQPVDRRNTGGAASDSDGEDIRLP